MYGRWFVKVAQVRLAVFGNGLVRCSGSRAPKVREGPVADSVLVDLVRWLVVRDGSWRSKAKTEIFRTGRERRWRRLVSGLRAPLIIDSRFVLYRLESYKGVD